MTKKAVKKVMKKKRQLKKQVKRQQQQQEQQQMMRPPMMMGYGHQMYGDCTIDQINSMTSALRLLQNENKKNETLINELKKQHKEAEDE